jgi:predicted metal-dependent peptidase
MKTQILKLLQRNPFFCELVLKLKIKESNEVPTLGVGVELSNVVLYYNKNYWRSLKSIEKVAVLEHELMHIVNNHINRSKDCEKQIFNIAADIAINQNILNLPKGGVTEKTFKYPPDLTTEQYYNLLLKDDKVKKIKINVGSIGSHKMWDKKEVPETVASEMVKKMLKEAFDECKKNGTLRGNVSDKLVRSILDTITPKANWRNILNSIIKNSVSAEIISTFKRPNRRFEKERGFRKAYSMKILIGIDTSGSISQKALSLFSAEVNKINLFDNDIYICVCDCDIQDYYKLQKRKKIKPVTGGGGTSFIPVFEKARLLKPDLLIYFTDGCGDYPKQTSINTLWALTEDYNVPFGKKIILGVENAS